MKILKYFIKWKNKETGEEGQGEPIEDKQAVNQWFHYVKYKYPEIEHTIQVIEVEKEGN